MKRESQSRLSWHARVLRTTANEVRLQLSISAASSFSLHRSYSRLHRITARIVHGLPYPRSWLITSVTNGGSSRDHLPRPDTVIALSIKEFGIREDSSFASSLRTYFLRRGAMVDLEEAIDLNREALDLRPRRHPDRSTSLHDLTACLSERYDTLGAMVDLERAIRVARAAFKPSPTEPRAPCYNLRLLANCLRDRSRAQRSICDLDEVIELRRAAWSWHCA